MSEESRTSKQISFLVTDSKIIELIYSKDQGSSFAIYNRKTEQITYDKHLNHGNFVITPCFDDNITSQAVLLPSKADEYTNEAELVADIKAIIHKYIDLEPIFENLCAYYVLFTYLSDCFDVTPYLRFKGDYGTGKSRAITVVGSICYKSIICGGATTPSPIFRMIDKYKGTLIFDEADFKFSDATEEIVKILTAGYMKGVPVLRTEKRNNGFETKAFDCYSPKVLATRYSWSDKALESRCITIEMRGRTRSDIPFNINLENFYKETQAVRNKLLMFRFKNYGKHTIDEHFADESLEPRLNQIMLPLQAVIQDTAVKADLTTIMQKLNQKIMDDRGMSLECEALRIILELFETGITSIRFKDIADNLNKGGEIEGKITAKKVGGIISERLQLPKKKEAHGYVVLAKLDDLSRLRKKYGL